MEMNGVASGSLKLFNRMMLEEIVPDVN